MITDGPLKTFLSVTLPAILAAQIGQKRTTQDLYGKQKSKAPKKKKRFTVVTKERQDAAPFTFLVYKDIEKTEHHIFFVKGPSGQTCVVGLDLSPALGLSSNNNLRKQIEKLPADQVFFMTVLDRNVLRQNVQVLTQDGLETLLENIENSKSRKRANARHLRRFFDNNPGVWNL